MYTFSPGTIPSFPKLSPMLPQPCRNLTETKDRCPGSRPAALHQAARRWTCARAALACLPLACLLGVGFAATELPPPAGAKIPLASFFAEFDASNLALTPDGKRLAFLTTLGTGRVGITMMDLETGKFDPLIAPKDENIRYFFWKGNDRIVYGGDLGGNESYAWLTFTLKDRRVKKLADSNGWNQRLGYGARVMGLLDELPNDPERILVDFSRPAYFNLRTENIEFAISGEPRFETGEFLADNAGVIRLRVSYGGDRINYEHRPDRVSEFRTYASSPIENPQFDPLFFNADNETLYLITHDQTDTGALRTFNTRTHEFGPVLFHDPAGEIDRVILSRDRRTLYGVTYNTDKPHYHWFDSGRARLQGLLDNALPGTFNVIVSSSDNERIAVVLAWSDRQPGVYYILNLDNPARGRPALMQFPIRVNTHLEPEQMQPMQPISYPARDGLVIHGYLTLPAGAAGKRVPLIINPHGGPFGLRDEWGFDPEVQFLASRGYAVLQPNYRGSGGYGQKFEEAGYREWGGKMQDDLSDGVKWAIAQGIADPDRVCIYGASYGGYAALAGVTFTPELYRCAINYVGVSDLRVIASVARYFERGSLLFNKTRIGEGAMLDEHSPVNYVQNIRVPTLHAYGLNDVRVIDEHWQRLESALKKYQKPYEFITESKEGHGFGHVDSRVRFYSQMEKFLAKYLAGPDQTGAQVPSAGSPAH
jgi:dipeptidyl aminopeptidase/acylaminoacyl peptidase